MYVLILRIFIIKYDDCVDVNVPLAHTIVGPYSRYCTDLLEPYRLTNDKFLEISLDFVLSEAYKQLFINLNA